MLADRLVPDWSVLMVQFQNLDPFQHRVWPYLNVDETGIDRPDWNAAAAQVIRGLDDAIGRLCELADKRGAAVMMVSDHGFGPCLGRIHVNRILVKAGVARLPGWAGRIGRRTMQAGDRLRLWGQKRDNPTARSASFDQSVTAQYPLRLETNPGLRPPPGHRRDGLRQLRRPPRRREDHRPGCRLARSTRPAPPPPPRSPRRRHPRPARPSFRRSSNRRGLPDRPGPRGLSRPDRPAR